MSASTIKRGVRGRGRGGYRPIRRPTTNITDAETPKKFEFTKEMKEPLIVSASTPGISATEQRFSSSSHRKPTNISNIAKQSCVIQVETCKLFEQLKISASNDKCKNDNDEDDADEKIRCEFCASLDHLTRNCIIFNSKNSSVCFNCKESGHYRNQCPKRGNNYRGQSFRSVKMYGPCCNVKFPGSTHSRCSINSDDEGVIGTMPVVKDHQQLKRINVPMPVPASSIKPIIKLRSKLKASETGTAGKQSVTGKSQSESSYIRSDTESDEFSSASEGNTREVNSKSNAKLSSSYITTKTDSSQRSALIKSDDNFGKTMLKNPPMKDKFDLSALEQIIRTPTNLAEFVKRTFEIHNYSQLEKHPAPSKSIYTRFEAEEKRLRLNDTLYPSKSQPNENEVGNKEKEEVQVFENNKDNINKDMELFNEDVKVANECENLSMKTIPSDTEIECNDADTKKFILCDNEILSEPDDNSSQMNPDVEFYGCDGAILSENDSELAGKTSLSCSTISEDINFNNSD